MQIMDQLLYIYSYIHSTLGWQYTMLTIHQVVKSRRSKMEYCIYSGTKIDQCNYHLSVPLVAIVALEKWKTKRFGLPASPSTSSESQCCTVTGNPRQPSVHQLSNLLPYNPVDILCHKESLYQWAVCEICKREHWESDISTIIRSGFGNYYLRFGNFVTIGHLI